ncbi:MAG: PilZ domain-containing protein [Candidatus Delongbacteria bacterium]|nr:PilZ domain-containing protein [Candidatus Delongbacteria bacterium]MBN2834060.1 PilZ domain-containing protein [Candidatus Delongbacteria bacterium]
MPNESDKRKFSRVEFNTDTYINFNNNWIKSKLLDISLKGVLLEIDEIIDFKKNDTYEVKINLPSSLIYMNFKALLVHISGKRFGLKFVHIDSDTFIHLRRLMELNIGSDSTITDELSFLSDN